MKKIFKSLVDLWNIYGGIALSALVAWLLKFCRESIDLVTSIIALSLAFCGALTFLKATVFKKKTNTIIEKAIQPSSVRAMNTASNPLATGEEIGTTIINTTTLIERTGKRVMNLIKKNIGAITTVIIAIIASLEGCFDFIWGLFPNNPIPFNAISIALGIAGTIVAVSTSGFGSAEFKEKLAELKDQFNGDVTDLTYINDKKFLERQIKTYTAAVGSVEKEIASLSNSYIETINDYSTCIRLNLEISEDLKDSHEEYVSKNRELENKLKTKKAALETYEKKLAELEAANSAE